MGDIEDKRIKREALDAVGAQRPTTGENRAQLAMRRYLGAVAFRSRDKDAGQGKDLGKRELKKLDDGPPSAG